MNWHRILEGIPEKNKVLLITIERGKMGKTIIGNLFLGNESFIIEWFEDNDDKTQKITLVPYDSIEEVSISLWLLPQIIVNNRRK